MIVFSSERSNTAMSSHFNPAARAVWAHAFSDAIVALMNGASLCIFKTTETSIWGLMLVDMFVRRLGLFYAMTLQVAWSSITTSQKFCLALATMSWT
ncbi:hypothetical protein BG58_03310 [Caballeronia jiangsuensis]|nr:hypothetical protein BG58_03310 [Caballeronia jiangsuensis]